MPIASKVNKLWQLFAGKSKLNPLDSVAQRFLQVFQDHGVEVAQIPRLLPQIRLDDLKTPVSLLAALSPQVLDQAAHLFGVRTAWLEGVDDEIYEYRHCYKQPVRFFEHLAPLCCGEIDIIGFPLRVLTATKHLDRDDSGAQLLIPVLVEKVADLGDEVIERYYIYCDGWDWSHPPGRIQLKAMVRMVFNTLGTSVPLYAITPGELRSILDRKLIPNGRFYDCRIHDFSLEDFALSEKESVHAKEVDEIPEVLKYIEDHNLESMISVEQFHPQPIPDLTPLPERPPEQLLAENPPEPPPRLDKPVDQKVLNNQIRWEPVIAAAELLWSKDMELSIAEVVRHLKMTPLLGVSKLSDSAIRKRIVKVAPPDIRGKSGRKPKKSS